MKTPILIFALLASLLSCRSSALEPEGSGQGAMISRAAYADGRLWLLTDDGVLSTLREGEMVRQRQALPEPVRDMCVQNGRIVTTAVAKEGAWNVRRYEGGQWAVVGSIDAKTEHFVAMACTPKGIVVAGVSHGFMLDEGTERGFEIRGEPGLGRVSATYSDGNVLYVATSAGEFGGNLKRIDLDSGHVSEVTRPARQICEQDKEGCDDRESLTSVMGILPVPWQPNCLFLAEGLVHFFPHGGVTRLCGETVEPYYTRDYAEAIKGQLKPGQLVIGEVAFFGLTRNEDTVLAIGLDGLHRFTADGQGAPESLPARETIDGITVSFMPDFILVYTEINRRRAAGGVVPLLVSR